MQPRAGGPTTIRQTSRIAFRRANDLRKVPVADRGSKNALAASLNETPCFRRFAAAFVAFHSKRTRTFHLLQYSRRDVREIGPRRLASRVLGDYRSLPVNAVVGKRP